MKEKILNFVKEKKELLIFIGVVLAVFSTVMIIANVATKVNNTTIVTENPRIITEEIPTPTETTPPVPEKIVEKMIRPLSEKDFDISRQFYSENSVLAVDAVIKNGSRFYESYGVSYVTLENTPFDVISTFSGEVTNVVYDEDYNNIVTVMHDNGVSTTYSSVSEVCVKVGDHLEMGEKIGIASASNYDKEALVHVHLELEVDNKKIDPSLAIGKTINEILALVS